MTPAKPWGKAELGRYLGRLTGARTKTEPRGGKSYTDWRDRAGVAGRALSQSGREIGPLPKVKDQARKDRAVGNFRAFCETYFRKTFNLPWSADHLKVIAKVEKAVLEGGLFALAMPRGSGKSSIVEAAVLWATLNGHKVFVCLIGASEAHARETLESMKMELATNEVLLDDYPEVCFPIRELEWIANRCAGQLLDGNRTDIGWTSVEIVLPTVQGGTGSGAIIKVAGLTGRIRGMRYKRSDGRSVRPDFVVLDDPQTDASARSASQCVTRHGLVAGAVLGLAGPGKKISGIMPCTVIHPGDVADLITDKHKHPEWNGERTKMVYAFPTDEKLWSRYSELRAESMLNHGDGRMATAFYVEHRAAMDEGAQVAWPERFNPDEHSAIQHAMNLRFQDEAAFLAEYQNEPKANVNELEGQIKEDEVTRKINGLKRGILPIGSSHLSAFVDVQGKLLYWMVCAWQDNFTGAIVDYGAYPDQKRAYFTLREAQRTLQSVAKGAGMEGAIYAGLGELTKDLLGKEWMREDGAALRVGLCLVDANWGATSDVVYAFCRQSGFAAQLLPSHGRYVGASGRPFSEYTKRPGDRVGLNWRMPNTSGKRAIRHATYDANFWKSFVAARLGVALGDPGCLSVFGRNPAEHQLLADHLTSEYVVKTEGRERVVDEWKMRPDHADNHWLDGVVGCAVAASVMGAQLAGTQAEAVRRRKVVDLTGYKGRR